LKNIHIAYSIVQFDTKNACSNMLFKLFTGGTIGTNCASNNGLNCATLID